jgi:hypothetical protein
VRVRVRAVVVPMERPIVGITILPKSLPLRPDKVIE